MYQKHNPTREAKRAVREYIEWWKSWKTFGLPKAGGVDDQEAEWVEAIEVVNAAFNRVEREAQIEAERQAEKQRQGSSKPRRRF